MTCDLLNPRSKHARFYMSCRVGPSFTAFDEFRAQFYGTNMFHAQFYGTNMFHAQFYGI